MNPQRGITTVHCGICKTKRMMHGNLHMASMIWHRDEGLECCEQQTDIVLQVKDHN